MRQQFWIDCFHGAKGRVPLRYNIETFCSMEADSCLAKLDDRLESGEL